MLRLAFHRLQARGRIRVEGRPRLGRGVQLDLAPGAVLHLGDRCVVGDGCRLDVGAGAVARIGAGAVLGERCVICCRELVEIAPRARLGREAVLIDFDLDVGDVEHPVREQGITTAAVHIGEDAVIGAAAGILRGVSVGQGARVDVRTVVTRDVPSRTRVGGVPASPALG